MMLCLQIFARHKHDLIKSIVAAVDLGSRRSGAAVGGTTSPGTPQDASSRGFRQDFEAKLPKTWPEKQVAAV